MAYLLSSAYLTISPPFVSRLPPQLANTEEWIDGEMKGQLGEILIRCVSAFAQEMGFYLVFTSPFRAILSLFRCNNVLYLRGVPEEES